MAGKSKLFAALTGDHRQRAETLYRERKLTKAARLFAKSGDRHRAAKVAIEAGEQQLAARYLLQEALGEIPDGYRSATAVEAGELLATAGHHREALPLFEAGGAHRQAATSAVKMRRPAVAARHYERARQWGSAGLYYQRAGRQRDALRVLQREAERLEAELRRLGDPTTAAKKERLDLEIAQLLASLGRRGEAAATVQRTAAATPSAARLLEQGGNYRAALDAYLKADQPQEALRLLPRVPALSAEQRAEILHRCGRHGEAGKLLADRGLHRQAATLFEAGELWLPAAAAWDAMGSHDRAAAAFLRAGRPLDAARAYEAGEEPQRAAEAYARADDHLAAARCYLVAEEPAAAAAAFERAGQPLDAARCHRQAGNDGLAAAVLAKISAGSPAYGPATLELAPMLLDQGRADEVLGRLGRLTSDARVGGAMAVERQYWEGRALEARGEGGAAGVRYRRIADSRPGYRDVAERLATLEKPAAAAPEAAGTTVAELPPGGAPGGNADGLPAGHLLAGRYQVQSELGRGGMGRVYKAFDRELREVVAVKTLLTGQADGVEAQRLLREVQICRKITHPNVVRVFDIGRYSGGLFVTMEFLEGRPLEAVLAGGDRLALTRVRLILDEVAAGLAEAHAMGVVHRDLKPANIFLTPSRVKVLDFGIASMAGFDTKLTRTGFSVGTPFYMAPEQLRAEPADQRSDLYALGVVAYALVAGRLPFEGDNLPAIALAHLNEPPPDPGRFRPGLAPEWSRLLATLLAKDPDQRYPSAAALRTALEALPD